MKFLTFKLICKECGKEGSLDTDIEVFDDPVTADIVATCNCGNEETI